MRRQGIEALADGTMLLTVLLFAGSIVLAGSAPEPTSPRSAGLRYAEEVRVSLFRTTLDGLGYEARDAWVPIPNSTPVETFLRIEVHVRSTDPGLDFGTANARILALAERLAPPGWSLAVTGNAGAREVVRIIGPASIPPTHYASVWSYPPFDDAPAETRLAVVLWINPPR